MDDGLPTPITRPRRGRVLGGVCAGLAARWGVPAGRVRLGFLAAGVLFGLGVMVYIAAWLIFPGESEDGRGQRGIVLLAQACGALLGLATLAGAGAAATLFGFGWVIVALAGAILVGTLAGWAKLGPAWALLPIGALVLPSAALAIGDVHVDPSTEDVLVQPRSHTELKTYKSGLGLLTLDLRDTTLPASGVVRLKVDAGFRRTLIALPHDRCVHVNVIEHDAPVLARVGAELLGRDGAYPSQVFGQWGTRSDEEAGIRWNKKITRPGPTLLVDYTSLRGQLVVRDYPDDVDPRLSPNWPGYPFTPEERPDTTGLPAGDADLLVREWKQRHEEQVVEAERIDDLIAGPCAKPLEAEKPKKQRRRTR